MAEIIGQTSAVLKDLTRITEQTAKQTRPNLWPLIATKLDAKGQAYVKVPITAALPFPKKLTDSMPEKGILVGYTQEYDQDTYTQRIALNSDLVGDVKAYDFSDVVAEAAIRAVLFKDWVASQTVRTGATVAMPDGPGFYTLGNSTGLAAMHSYANMGKNTFANKIAKSGTSIAALFADLGTARAALRGFKDNEGLLLNNVSMNGETDMVCQYPLSYDNNMRAVLNAEMVPMPVTNAAGTENVGGASMTNTLRNSARGFPDGYLSSSDGFFLHYVGMPRRPLVLVEDYDSRVTVIGFGTPEEALHHTCWIIIRQRFVLGFLAYWRSVQVS